MKLAEERMTDETRQVALCTTEEIDADLASNRGTKHGLLAGGTDTSVSNHSRKEKAKKKSGIKNVRTIKDKSSDESNYSTVGHRSCHYGKKTSIYAIRVSS